MNHAWPILWCLLAWPGEAETRFEQVHPVPKTRDAVEKTPGQQRAIVLLHGLRIHTFSTSRVHQAGFHDWQIPGSFLVQSLGKNADVYCFAYSQNTPLENICEHNGLATAIRKLNFLGYTEIVLVGH